MCNIFMISYFYARKTRLKVREKVFTFLKQLNSDHFERRIFLLLSILRNITVTNIIRFFKR